MRLLLSVFPGFVPGGAQLRFVQVANAMAGRWRHAIVSLDGSLSCAVRLDPSLDVAYHAAPDRRAEPMRRLRALRALVARLRPDAMLTHNWGSIEWALANRTLARPAPHLHAEDGFNPDERSRQLARRVWARRLALGRATVAVPSQTLASIARDRWRIAADRLVHLPNGVDLERFRPRPDRPPAPASWGLAPGGKLVGTVAALRPEKNVARLIEAVAQAAPVAGESTPAPLRLVVAGDGPERAALERLARDALGPGRAAFVGHLDDPAPFYARLDLFALSSDTEQMPLSLLEAMASGLAVAATDVGDVRAMVDDENRPYVTARDASALGAALGRLASSPDHAATIGARNRARAVERFGAPAMLSGWESLLERVAAGGRPAPGPAR